MGMKVAQLGDGGDASRAEESGREVAEDREGVGPVTAVDQARILADLNSGREIPPALVRRSLELLATEVMPRFR